MKIPKGVMTSRKSMNKQYNEQTIQWTNNTMANGKDTTMTKNGRQKSMHWEIRRTLKIGDELGCSGKVNNSFPTQTKTEQKQKCHSYLYSCHRYFLIRLTSVIFMMISGRHIRVSCHSCILNRLSYFMFSSSSFII